MRLGIETQFWFIPFGFPTDHVVKAALEQAIEEAREMRRESASRIVVPDVGGGAIGPGPGAGGGKIKF